MSKDILRLDRLLANYGLCSRSATKRFVRENTVSVNGKRVSNVSEHIKISDVRIDGKPIEPLLHLAVHKPNGYVCTRDKGEETKIIYDLLPESYYKRKPILSVAGRLDKWVTGLVIMSQDGDLVKKIITPKKKPWGKEYIVTAQAPYKGNEAEIFQSAKLILRGESTPCKPANFELLDADKHIARIVLQEGRYHQVRRMLAAVGNKAIAIHRVRIGPILLGDLKPGQWRKLTPEDVRRLAREEIQPPLAEAAPTPLAEEAPNPLAEEIPIPLAEETPIPEKTPIPLIEETPIPPVKKQLTSPATERAQSTKKGAPSIPQFPRVGPLEPLQTTQPRIVQKLLRGKLIVSQLEPNISGKTDSKGITVDEDEGEDKNEEDSEEDDEDAEESTIALNDADLIENFDKYNNTYVDLTPDMRTQLLHILGGQASTDQKRGKDQRRSTPPIKSRKRELRTKPTRRKH